MFDHIGFPVSDYARAKAFYSAAWAPFGYALLVEVDQTDDPGQRAAGFGPLDNPTFWIGSEGLVDEPLHIAFAALSRATVDAFHRAALSAGGRDNGKPGLRPNYGPHYYAAFVRDPDGQNIEAVCRTPVESP